MILSYQCALHGVRTGRGATSIEFPNGPLPQNRIYSRTLITKMIHTAWREGIIGEEDLRDRKKRGLQLNLMIAAHFGRAEISALRDFSRIKRKIDGVRSTYATLQHRQSVPYSVKLPDGRGILVLVRFIDTFLLAPAGASLAALGVAMKMPKLIVPDVVDESGKAVRGINRMDLAFEQHPSATEAYAITDGIIAVNWVRHVAELADEWGVNQFPPTIASLGTSRMITAVESAGYDRRHFFGYVKPKGEEQRFLPEVKDIVSLVADGFHGGLNVAFAAGVFEGDLTDFDIKGAYSTGMAAFRQPAWAEREFTTMLERLAILDGLSAARVKFRFPPDTRYPCLPVDVGNYGLVYPLEGVAEVCGPELVLAAEMGAQLDIEHGIVVPWENSDGPRPLVDFTRQINIDRARYKSERNVPAEQLVKTAGNAAYGKLAQGVGAMKSIPRVSMMLDTRTGERVPVPPSRVTQPLFAAYITSLLRATLCEIVANIPEHRLVLSATTDGFLTSATREEVEVATAGPIASFFVGLRQRVDLEGSGDILEIKHRATKVLVLKTRGAVTLDPGEGNEAGTRILARAGHKLAERPPTREDEARIWEEVIRGREPGDRMTYTTLIPLPEQYAGDRDLVSISRSAASNFDYDFKRRPTDVHDHDGLIRFMTEPYRTVEEFLDLRRSWDTYRKSAGAVLKSVDDWRRFVQWRKERRRGSHLGRTAFEDAIVTAWAKGLPGFPRWSGRRRSADKSHIPTANEIVSTLTEAGISGVTVNVLKNAARRESDPRGTVAEVLATDHDLARRLAPFLGRDVLEQLAPPGSLESTLNGISLNDAYPKPLDNNENQRLDGNGINALSMGDRDLDPKTSPTAASFTEQPPAKGRHRGSKSEEGGNE